MTCTCPTCGSSVDKRVLVSLENNRMSVGDQIIQLRPSEADIAYVLAEKMPGAVSRENLVIQTRGIADTSSDPLNAVAVHVASLRRLLRPYGLEIKVTYTRGYRLCFT